LFTLLHQKAGSSEQKIIVFKTKKALFSPVHTIGTNCTN